MKTVILGSGQGTNAQAILQAKTSQLLGNAEIVAILSDKRESGILKIAQSHNIENRYLDPGPFNSKFDENAENAWIETMKEYEPDLIVLAGFMRILSPFFIDAFHGRILNLHPSLLPSFTGLHAVNQAFDHGVKISGCTVHWVNEDLDGGRIIAQAPVRIMQGDTVDMVRQKIQESNTCYSPRWFATCRLVRYPSPRHDQINTPSSSRPYSYTRGQLYELAPNNWCLTVNSDDGHGKIEGFFSSIDDAQEAISELEFIWENTFDEEFHHEEFEDTDWTEAYKLHFKPWSNDTIHWVPEWEKETYPVPPGHHALYLDPGMAFGTGNHETTRLCLESLISISKLSLPPRFNGCWLWFRNPFFVGKSVGY